MLRPELGALPLPMLHALVVRSLRSIFAHPERVPKAAMNAAADEFVRVFATPRGRIAFFHAAREIYLEDPHGATGFWDRLPSLSRPAYFVFGGRDWLVPRSFPREELRHRLGLRDPGVDHQVRARGLERRRLVHLGLGLVPRADVHVGRRSLRHGDHHRRVRVAHHHERRREQRRQLPGALDQRTVVVELLAEPGG